MMEDSTPNNPNGPRNGRKKSPSSSKAPRRISLKDRKHRQVKNECVDALETYFQIVTEVELLKKPKRNWSEVTELVWKQIFVHWELKKQQKALMKLEEYAVKAAQIVESVRDAVEKAKIELNGLESLMQPLQQQFLDIHDPQLASDVDSSVIKGHALEVGEAKASIQTLDYELDLLKHGINAEVQKLRRLANMEFSVPSLQQPDPNDNRNQVHLLRKKQGHIALKVFFYMHTGEELRMGWKEAEAIVKAKRDEAIEIGKKLKDAAIFKQTVIKSALAAFEEAKRQVNDCKCLLQRGVSSEVAVRDMDIQALGLDDPLLAGYTQNGQRAMIYNPEWNDEVLWDLQNSPEPSDSAQMLAPLEATGYGTDTNSQVAFEADGDIECWLIEISKQFPEIKEGGLHEELLEIAKRVPKIGLESMDSHGSHGSKLKDRVDNTYPEVGALPQNKRKPNQPKKLPIKKKGKQPA